MASLVCAKKENGEQNASEEISSFVPRRVSREMASDIELDLTAGRRLNAPVRGSPEWLVLNSRWCGPLSPASRAGFIGREKKGQESNPGLPQFMKGALTAASLLEESSTPTESPEVNMNS